MTPVHVALLVLAAAGAGCYWYAARVEPRRFQLCEVEVRLDGWPTALDGFTILHLTDLHSRGRGPLEAWVADLAAALPEPDLVALTGDFAETPNGLAACLEALSGVTARVARYAVLGNNDLASPAHRAAVEDGLAAQGVTVLWDECVRIGTPEAGFWLGGLGFYHLDRESSQFVFPVAATFAAANDGAPRILLGHSPDALIEAVGAGVCLYLAGHTHGGQICLPGARMVHNNTYRFRGDHFARGRYDIAGCTLYVSRGLGVSRPPLRTWCPPEATLFRVRPR